MTTPLISMGVNTTIPTTTGITTITTAMAATTTVRVRPMPTPPA